MKYLLIDGNNLAVRCAFANETLTNSDGIPTGVHYGVFNSLINLKQNYHDCQFLLVWDGHSIRRKSESEDGVKKGLIKSAYKANRIKEEQPKPLLDFYAQSPFLKRGIEQTGIPQIHFQDFEADDVIASYCKKLGSDEIVIVTSDYDYLQLLSDSVSIWDGMKSKLTTKKDFMEEYKIQPNQYIDVGALEGDDGDNIFGVPSVGEKTALEAIQTYGSWQNTIDAYKKILDPLRTKYPDLSSNEAEFKRLQAILPKPDSKKPKYPEITINMPYTGVALAIEDKKIKEKIPKTTLMTAMFEERVRLAYSLKKMDGNIENLPEIKQGNYNQDKLLEYFNYYGISTLVESLSVFA